MINIKNLILSITSASFLIGIIACTDGYNTYNTNPYDTTKEEMQRDGYLLSSALIGMEGWVVPLDVNANQFIECLLGGSFSGYLSDSNSGFNGKNFACYNPEEHWNRVPFNDVIPAIFIRHAQVAQATDDPIPLAVSDIIKVTAMQRITDIFGPIPYSKIGSDGNITAPYDSQQAVYNKMFEELDNAIDVLTKNRTNDFSPKCDKIYSGNILHWIKYANSLKLRLAMRIANVDAATAQKKAEEAANNEIGTMTSNEDNAYMPVASTNPFRVIMYEYNNGDSRVSADITSYMNGYNDPRRPFYFTTSTFDDASINGYIGLRSGIQIPGGATIKQYSNMNVAKDSKVMWMNAAEISFLKAEGASEDGTWALHQSVQAQQPKAFTKKESNSLLTNGEHLAQTITLMTEQAHQLSIKIPLMQASQTKVHPQRLRSNGMPVQDLKLIWNASLLKNGLLISHLASKHGLNTVVQAIPN